MVCLESKSKYQYYILIIRTSCHQAQVEHNVTLVPMKQFVDAAVLAANATADHYTVHTLIWQWLEMVYKVPEGNVSWYLVFKNKNQNIKHETLFMHSLFFPFILNQNMTLILAALSISRWKILFWKRKRAAFDRSTYLLKFWYTLKVIILFDIILLNDFISYGLRYSEKIYRITPVIRHWPWLR